MGEEDDMSDFEQSDDKFFLQNAVEVAPGTI